MTTISSNGTIWSMVQAANPGASDSEIWKKTDSILKDHNITWDSAKSGKTASGSTADYKAEKEKIAKELSGKAAPKPAAASNTTSQKGIAATGIDTSNVDSIYDSILAGRTPISTTDYVFGKKLNKNASLSDLAAHSASFGYFASGQQHLGSDYSGSLNYASLLGLDNNYLSLLTNPNLFSGALDYNQNNLASLGLDQLF